MKIRVIILVLIIITVLFNGCEKDTRKIDTFPIQSNGTILKDQLGVKLPYSLQATLSTGTLFNISVPEDWDGLHFLIYIPEVYRSIPDKFVNPAGKLTDNDSLAELVNNMGWGCASIGYRTDKLNISDAVSDLIELKDTLLTKVRPENLYLAGKSIGGLIITLTLEKYPDAFSGGLTLGAPVGNYYQQEQYTGDFYILFNYFFKDELMNAGIELGDPAHVPEQTISDWKNGTLQQKIINILIGNEDKIASLLNTSKVPVDRNNSSSAGQTILDLLGYNILSINIMNKNLGGCIFNNKSPRRWYLGSGNDWQLNRNISRIKTTDFDAARKNISNYETTGNLLKPLVSLHNTGDPLSLYWHETLYRYKLLKSHAASMQTNISVAKYGRNDFTSSEVMASLALLVYKVTLSNLNIPEKAFTSSQMENELLQKSKELSIDPKIIKYNIPVVGD